MRNIQTFDGFSRIYEETNTGSAYDWKTKLSGYDWRKNLSDIQGLSTRVMGRTPVKTIAWRNVTDGDVLTFKAMMMQKNSGEKITFTLSTPLEKFKDTISNLRVEIVKSLGSEVVRSAGGLKQAKGEGGKMVWYTSIGSFSEKDAPKVFKELDKAIKKYPALTK